MTRADWRDVTGKCLFEILFGLLHQTGEGWPRDSKILIAGIVIALTSSKIQMHHQGTGFKVIEYSISANNI